MKKFLLFTNIMLLGVIFFQTFNNSGRGELHAAMISDTIPQVNIRLPETEGILVPGPDRCDDPINYDTIRLDNLITLSQAKILADNYYADNGKRYIAYQGPTEFGEEDARSAWFSLRMMKAFLWQVEKKACQRKCKLDSLGIRIYYGKYPVKAKMIDAGFSGLVEYGSHHTLFFMPTYYNGTKHIDFDPRLFQGERGCNPVPLRDLLSPAAFQNPHNASMIFSLGAGGNSNNHGGLLPPPPGQESGFGNN